MTNEHHSDAIIFPCERCPEDATAQRLLGLYDQVQEGRRMQRVKVHGGRISSGQLRALAALARTHTPDAPLHLTTRQDIEFHNLKPEEVPTVQRGLAAVGLTTVGACGDTLRNVTVCPGNGLCPGTRDVGELAGRLRAAAEALSFIRSMPRKFKISISGCERGCARPWINDLGLIARPDGRFRAVLAGSLGARPGTGIELYEDLEPWELIPLALAALRLFNQEGDREHRTRARLRHVRERLGNRPFAERLDEGFEAEKSRGDRAEMHLPVVSGECSVETRLHLPLGDLAPDLAERLAEVVEQVGGHIRIGLEHDLWLYTPGDLPLPAELKLLAEAPSMVVCPGSTWCQRGLVNTRQAAARIHQSLAGLGAERDVSICLNGCPNNCGHGPVADIGLVGRIRRPDGERTECFQLLVGGDKGAGAQLAEPLHDAVPADQADAVVRCLLQGYAAKAAEGESFAMYARRNQKALAVEIQGVLSR
jgi:sulfite reductase (ferredoxin)